MALGRKSLQNNFVEGARRPLCRGVFAAILLCVVCALPACAAQEKPLPSIHEVRFRQLGDDLLIAEVKGSCMSLPTFQPGESAGLLCWEKGSGSKLRSKQGNEIAPGVSLAQRVRFRETDEGDFTMEIIGAKPLQLQSIKGMSGSDHISIELRAMRPALSPVPKHPPRAAEEIVTSDEPITLELRDALPYEAFHIFACYAGMNLIMEPAVSPKKISISFHEAPFQQVFSFLLRSYGLSYGVLGKTLVVGTDVYVGKVLGLHVTKAYSIAYADMSKVPKLMQTLARLPEMPVADERTRQVYVTCSESQHRDVEAVIDRIDHPGRQVMLEARLIEVNKDAKEELETLITAAYNGWLFSSGPQGGSAEYTYANGEISFGEGIAVPGVEAKIPVQVIDPALKMLDAGLRVIETKKRGKILASPSVMALDGEKAVIKLTRNYLYQSSVDDKGNAKFTEQETGPTLEITPFIGRDGYITLRLNISTGEIIGFHKSGISEAPETTKREIETRIRVRDGELFVIGGLYQETQSKSVSRVPVLGYVPLLGELFTSRQSKNVKSEMAFIVIPHIMDIQYGGAEVIEVGKNGDFSHEQERVGS